MKPFKPVKPLGGNPVPAAPARLLNVQENRDLLTILASRISSGLNAEEIVLCSADAEIQLTREGIKRALRDLASAKFIEQHGVPPRYFITDLGMAALA